MDGWRELFRLHFRFGSNGEFSFFVGWFWVGAVVALAWWSL